MADIFTPPTGTPNKKPANVVQYPDFPQFGKSKSSMMKKNSLNIQPPTGKKVP
jgi:hypothetical protein